MTTDSSDRKARGRKPLIWIGLALVLLCLFIYSIGLSLSTFRGSLALPSALTDDIFRTPSGGGIVSTNISPGTEAPLLLTPSANLATPTPAGEISAEISEDAQIDEDVRLGEYNLTYSPWMRPGSSDSVLLTVIIPEEFIALDVREVARKDISPQAAHILGSVEEDRGNLFLDRVMRVELDSLTLQVQSEYPAVQEVRYEPNTPTYWAWSILAPAEEGFHRMNLKIFLDEYSDLPSWFRTYQVEVLLPSPSPLPTSTPSPPATQTPVPTVTSTPAPTQTVFERIAEQFVEESSRIFLDLLPTLITLLTAVGGLFIAHLRRRDRIREIELSLPSLESEGEIKAAKAELKRLREIRWWQFWKLTGSSK